MTNSKAQIIATIGPASENVDTLRSMIQHRVDVIRLNFSWGDLKIKTQQIELIRQLERECKCRIPIIVDLPGPRIQTGGTHSYDDQAHSAITEEDKEYIEFAVKHNVDYIAVSFVGVPQDIEECRKIINTFSGKQKIISKIERALAIESLDQIIAVSDVIMVARGDLGNEVPLEQIPFIQKKIIRKAKAAGKPVIIATQMLISMVNELIPTRAEVTDVTNAILEGADALMLSEETAIGKYPIEAVTMMEKIIIEAEGHMSDKNEINLLCQK